MRAVVQRVSRARSTPGGAISAGLVVLLGVAQEDTAEEAERLAGKMARLRIFERESGKFDRSLLDMGGAALVVSQFTLIADTARGQPAVVFRRRATRDRRAAVRALLHGASRSESTSRPASSARGWQSSS